MNIKPLGERILVKPIASDDVTKSGIVLPDTAKEKPQQGVIIAAGPGRMLDDGKRVPMEVKEGDVVLFAKFAGTEMKIDSDVYMILSAERDVLAVLEK
ncbi:MAG: co-chaperone GroES [Firmicutes bacterium]|nr:co-chaperone GroES [Bacillota bacterium]